MKNNDEIEDIIAQLQQLQLQQTELLARLEKARGEETENTDTGHTTRASVADRTDRTKTSTDDINREFVLGDKVKIKNPNRFQPNKGKIIKIGKSRITVETASGGKITRAPKNLQHD
jgi:hypothetical protein